MHEYLISISKKTTVNEFFSLIAHHIFVVLALHLVVSIVLSFVVSKIILKRFVKHSKKVDAEDKKRLAENALRPRINRLFFQISLHKNNQIAIFVFMLLFNISIPFLGYFFTLWVTWFLVNVKYKKKTVTTNMLNLDEFEMSFLKVERTFGEGSMNDLMLSTYASKSKKLKALSSLAANLSPANLKIIRQTLASTDDEVRMFGYAIINKAETALNQKINLHLDIIYAQAKKGENQDAALVANSQKELAFLYWEMIYTELSHESLKGNFLNSVILYINEAKEYYLPLIDTLSVELEAMQKEYVQEQDGTDKLAMKEHELQTLYKTCSNLYMLMGRVYMQRKNYREAKKEFTIAQELVAGEDTFLIPYLAEVYYDTGRYNIVQSVLKSAKGLELNATLYPIVDQWKVAS